MEKKSRNSPEQLTLFAAGSHDHAKTLVSQEKIKELMENDPGYGRNIPVLLTSYIPDTSSWKTSQICLTGECQQFSETWPRSGMMQNGTAYRVSTLVHRRDATVCGLLPTPLAQETLNMWSTGEYLLTTNVRKSGAKIGSQLSWLMAKWHLQNGNQRDKELVPDPCLYEALMGFPQNWTDLHS